MGNDPRASKSVPPGSVRCNDGIAGGSQKRQEWQKRGLVETWFIDHTWTIIYVIVCTTIATFRF